MEIVHFRQSSPTINSITQDRGVTRSEFRGLDMMIDQLKVTNSHTVVEITMTYHFY